MFFWMKLYRLTTREYLPLIEKLIQQEEEHIRDLDHLLAERRSWDRGVIRIQER
jgi:hypothetical protein